MGSNKISTIDLEEPVLVALNTIDTVADQITAVDANVDSIKTTVEDNNAKINTVNTGIEAINTELAAIKKSVSDGKTLVANAIIGKGIDTATDMTWAQLATNIESISTLEIGTSDATAIAGDLLLGKTAYANGGKIEGTMANNGAVAPSALAAGDSYTVPAGYHDGTGVVTAKSLADQTTGDASATQILSSKTAWVNGTQVTGTMANNGAVNQTLAANGTYTIPAGYHDGTGKVTQSLTGKDAATYTPGTSDQTIAANQWLTGTQTIKGDANLVSTNIKSGVSIFGVSGNSNVVDTSAGDATAAQILSGKKAYVDGALVTGSMANNGAVAPSALNAGGSYTIPAGYHNGSGKVTTNTLASQTSADATAAQILSGKTAWVNGSKITGSIASQAAQTITPGTSNKTIAAGKYLSGAQTIKGDANLVAGNIKKGTSIFGVTGTYDPSGAVTVTKSVTASTGSYLQDGYLTYFYHWYPTSANFTLTLSKPLIFMETSCLDGNNSSVLQSCYYAPGKVFSWYLKNGSSDPHTTLNVSYSYLYLQGGNYKQSNYASYANDGDWHLTFSSDLKTISFVGRTDPGKGGTTVSYTPDILQFKFYY